MSIEILSVEDDENIAYVVTTALEVEGYRVLRAASGREALDIVLGRQQPDLIILDVMMPDLDGFEIFQRMREEGVTTPVIFLTAMDSVGDKVRGLTMGADDYVTKPFSVEELTARVRSLLRRTGKAPVSSSRVFMDLEIDEDAHVVLRQGDLVELSPTEFRLLSYLTRNVGQVLSRRQIVESVWGYSFDGDPNIVESYVSMLRRKIDTSPPTHIRTIRGIGYRFEAE
jgi:two-component system, OmpR family, response regulator